MYGNIILFAALVPLVDEDTADGRALQVVFGAAVSTFLAHAFAALIGARAGGRVTRGEVRNELRDATPILVSAVLPCFLMAAAWADLVPGSVAIIASDVYLMVRLALLGLIVNRPGSRRTLVAGLALAGVAAAIALLKVILSH
ncbi:hypothetical protein AB0K60_33470 [Thermopolyspora sp. NPDC052614]|uniref:hypothetical protein n=1 Tax=Thermopolyspora sp. NPDC052614 TaxID=3155682 RepID=UPI00341A1654